MSRILRILSIGWMRWTGNGQGLLENIQGHATEQRIALGGLQSRPSSKYRHVPRKEHYLDHHKNTSLYYACGEITLMHVKKIKVFHVCRLL